MRARNSGMFWHNGDMYRVNQVHGKAHYGKYLAGDEGYTFDISRRLASGFRTGVFFTRTNVSAELFGEGSFDKGFYFWIPIRSQTFVVNLFYNRKILTHN